jgi:hypothetical protein
MFSRAVISIEFAEIERHINFANLSIQKEIKAIEAEIKRKVQPLNPDDQDAYDAYHDAMIDEHWRVSEVFPRIQWRSEFLTVYSTFEYMLNKLCCEIQNRSGFELALKDLSGQGIERARNYFVKVAGVKLPFDSPHWQRAKFLALIRNAIAHKNGGIKYEPENLKSLSAKLIKEPHIKLKQCINLEDAEIVLSYEFVKQSVVEFRKVMMDICDYELYVDES